MEQELTDLILLICHGHAKPVHIKSYLEKNNKEFDQKSTEFKMGFIRAIKTLKHYNLIEERTALVGGDRCLTTSPLGHKIVSDYGSFSSWRLSESKANHKQKREQYIMMAMKIIGGLGVVVSITLGILKYHDDVTIKNQQLLISKLENELEKLRNTIDKKEH